MYEQLTKDHRGGLSAIREYEHSVAMPPEDRLTYVDAERHIHLKAGDDTIGDLTGVVSKYKEYLRFGYEVDQATCGVYERYDFLKICDTPEIFIKAGFAQKPMLYTQRHLADAIHSKSEDNTHWHGLSIEQVKRFPELFETPVMLCDSPARDDAMIAVLSGVDHDKLPLIAIIKPNGIGVYELGDIQTNMILSVYGRRNFPKYFSDLITPNRVIYLNKERGQKLEQCAELQLFGAYSNLDLDTIIRRPACLVKTADAVVSLSDAVSEARAVARENGRSIEAPVRPTKEL